MMMIERIIADITLLRDDLVKCAEKRRTTSVIQISEELIIIRLNEILKKAKGAEG